MSVMILPTPACELVPVRALRTGDWIGESPDGPWHLVQEPGVTCVLVGDTRADAQVVDVVDPDLPVWRLDAAAAPRRG